MTELVYKDIKALIITIFDMFKKLENRLIMLNIDIQKTHIKLLEVKIIILFHDVLKSSRKSY